VSFRIIIQVDARKHRTRFASESFWHGFVMAWATTKDDPRRASPYTLCLEIILAWATTKDDPRRACSGQFYFDRV